MVERCTEPLTGIAFDALHFIAAEKVELLAAAIAACNSYRKPMASRRDGLGLERQIRS